jgi:mono/diheme cytochrome c family protein
MVRKITLAVGIVVALAIAGAPAYFYAAYPRMRAPLSVTAPSTPDAIARGKYLVSSFGCASCHSPVDDTRPGDFPREDLKFSGRVFPAEMGLPGTVIAPNISPDPETGIGTWTDGEVLRAIREGISRDGRPLFPFMNYPAYRKLPESDLLAMIAYLRTQKPIRNNPGRTKLNFPVNLIVRTVPEPVNDAPAVLPPPGVERGKLLMAVGMCGDCHSQSKQGKPIAGMELAGGQRFSGAFGVVYSANITSHVSAGIGAYSNDDLIRVFREGKNRSGRELWVMPWSATRNLSDEDVMSFIAALRQVPANPYLVPAPELNATKRTN